MASVKKLMKKKASAREEIYRRLPKDQGDAVWREASERLASLLERYSSLPKGVQFHLENKILPAAAIYLTLKEKTGQQEAYRIMEESTYRTADNIGKKLAKLMRVPGMRSLFMKVWDPLTRKMFGEKSGFRNVFYPKTKNEYRMDVTSCPYFRYFSELGCPELTAISCGSDDRVYGNLPGIRFERTTTLGRGGERCDFCIRKV
ncbi:MAG: L-2-amino-thiazoline-4-carboxylic acid hydrolase [Clostridia bacterium]|nr:L-2-amino-thiazoline-4-carboxylic acid hydrolase [Clostridia bacterium]